MNPKQRHFALEYLVDFNAKRAATAAGYSVKTAEQQGYQLLQHPEVAAFIGSRSQKRAAKLELTADRVAEEMAKIAFLDPRKAVHWGSRFVERPEDAQPDSETPEDQPHGGSLKRRRKGDDESDGFYVTSVEMIGSDEIDDDTAAAISEVAQTKEGVRIKFHDKLTALNLLGRHLGMFKDEAGPQMTVRFVIDGAPEADQ